MCNPLTDIPLPDCVESICRDVACAGGRAWLVGGWVRDGLMIPKIALSAVDYDLEVYGLSFTVLQSIAVRLGSVALVGKQFSVLKLRCGGIVMDLALPRNERSSGSGHCDFRIEADPQMTPQQACSRRDFTINAMLYDPLQHQLLDFYDGKSDLQNNRLRHIGDAFVEDPLRPLRAMQLCARFNLVLSRDTAALCRSMVPMANALPMERIWHEWRKWALADYPDAGLRALADSGWLACYAQLVPLADTPQDPRWHPEGDVWLHTIQVCRHAARVATRASLTESQRLVLLFSGLCHDLGKPMTTTRDHGGGLHSKGHAQKGLGVTEDFLTAIGAPSKLRAQVMPLIREHLVHLNGKPTAHAVRRLACRLQPSSIEMWEHLVEADASGRHPNPVDRPAKRWLQLAQEMTVMHKPQQPLVTGKWLLAQGMRAGPEVGMMLDRAWQAQLNGEIGSIQDAEIWWQKHHDIDKY